MMLQRRRAALASRLRGWRLVAALVVLLGMYARGYAGDSVWVSDQTAPSVDPAAEIWDFDWDAHPAQFQQPVTPRVESPTTTPGSRATQTAQQQFWTSFGTSGRAPTLAAEPPPLSATYVAGQESAIRATTDLGDLLGESPAVLDLHIQRRNPIVNDPRVRGSQIGSLAASGSYWVPARIDLDTPVSKIDSRLVDHVVVIPGPYTALYGPGRQFIDFELLQTPRYNDGYQSNAATSLGYRTNGEQWYGRADAWGGNDVWGFRAGYGHRTGSDYADGDDVLIPGSYKSRDVNFSLGGQLTPQSALEGQALRLDQTDVELAGQAFDLDWLITDAYELKYVFEDPAWADSFTIDGWYNQTRFDGSSQRPSKRKQFPVFDLIGFTGFTHVDSISSGYSAASHWTAANGERVDAGADLRYVKQQLDEITSGTTEFQWIDQNSPIPKSDWVNPGLFVDLSAPLDDYFTFGAGARVDYLQTAVLASQADLNNLGVNSDLSPMSAQQIWGSDQLSKNDILALGYLSLDAKNDDGWGAGMSVGYSERPPNLTERYAVETFIFVLQNGLNTVTGDPGINKEKLIQADFRISRQMDDFRVTGNAYYSWIRDYITYEATSVFPPFGDVEQVNLKFVNTELATIWGLQGLAEYKWNDWLTPFATVQYLQGTDRTRNGAFDTVPASPGFPNSIPSMRNYGVPRGTNSGIAAAGNTEALPIMPPLESRVGLRWEEKNAATRWGVELSSRMVDNQTRVAASLLETPTGGFTVCDLRTFVRPREHLQFVAGVENFLDKQYQTYLDYRSQNSLALDTFQPGINFYFGMDLGY